MSTKQLPVLWTAVCLLPLPLYAQQQEEAATKPSTAEALMWSVLPIVIVGVLVFFFFRFAQRKQRPLVARHQQHMERVEQSLDRIARALERKDTDAGS